MAKIYLISPEKIDEDFFAKLDAKLATGLVSVFQLRLKNCDKVEEYAVRVKEICARHGCLFLLNDDAELAYKIGCDGVHIGQDDGLARQIRKKFGEKFIIGVSCYDSRHLALEAVEGGADYVSFGTFFTSKTKNSQGKPTSDIIDWAHEILGVSVVVIGGIDANNCHLVKNADFVAVISCVWDDEGGLEDLNAVLA